MVLSTKMQFPSLPLPLPFLPYPLPPLPPFPPSLLPGQVEGFREDLSQVPVNTTDASAAAEPLLFPKAWRHSPCSFDVFKSTLMGYLVASHKVATYLKVWPQWSHNLKSFRTISWNPLRVCVNVILFEGLKRVIYLFIRLSVQQTVY